MRAKTKSLPDQRNRTAQEAHSDSVTAASASIFCVPWWRWGESTEPVNLCQNVLILCGFP